MPGTRLRILLVFSQLMHAMREVILTLPKRKQPYPKPRYLSVDHPVRSAITVETKVIFYCANPRKNLDKVIALQVWP